MNKALESGADARALKKEKEKPYYLPLLRPNFLSSQRLEHSSKMTQAYLFSPNKNC